MPTSVDEVNAIYYLKSIKAPKCKNLFITFFDGSEPILFSVLFKKRFYGEPVCPLSREIKRYFS